MFSLTLQPRNSAGSGFFSVNDQLCGWETKPGRGGGVRGKREGGGRERERVRVRRCFNTFSLLSWLSDTSNQARISQFLAIR